MANTVAIPMLPKVHQAHPPRTVKTAAGAEVTDNGQKYRFSAQVNGLGPDGTDKTSYVFECWTEVRDQMEAKTPGSFMPWVAQQIAALADAAPQPPAGLDGTYSV